MQVEMQATYAQYVYALQAHGGCESAEQGCSVFGSRMQRCAWCAHNMLCAPFGPCYLLPAARGRLACQLTASEFSYSSARRKL